MSAVRKFSRKPTNPYKQAIAMAIDLERTHDAMCGIIGHSIPLENRITTEPRGKRKLPLNLPRKHDLETLTNLANTKIAEIENVIDEIGGAMTSAETAYLHDIANDLSERSLAHTHLYVPTRGRNISLDPDDRISLREKMLRDIERAADTPPPPLKKAENTNNNDPKLQDHLSFTIDIMMEGFLEHYNVDQTALYNELKTYYDKFTRIHSYVMLASPSMLSNTYPALTSLGRKFPKATFRLRGKSLEMEQAFLTRDENGFDVDWKYETRTQGKHVLVCHSLMAGHDLFSYPRKALRDVTGDERFHEALMIEMTDRFNLGAMARVEFLLRPAYSHIDPPHANKSYRMKVKRPTFATGKYRMTEREKQNLVWATIIDNMITDKGHKQRRNIKYLEGEGFLLQIADPGSDTISHRYVIKNDTINDGEEAVQARIVNILKEMTSEASRRPRKTKLEERPQAVVAEEKPAFTVKKESQLEAIKAMDEDNVANYEKATKIDSLLTDVLAMRQQLKEINIPELHMQEGILSVKRMVLDNESSYSLVKYDRVMGRPSYAVGTITTTRHLTASTIEALRDGSVRKLIDIYPEFAYSQVRKVTRCEGATVITIRVQLVDKS